MSKSALGRGLGALLGSSALQSREPVPSPLSSLPTPLPNAGSEVPPAPAGTPLASPGLAGEVLRVRLEALRPCPFQPRKEFPAEALSELADSIREQGIVQPLLVRRQGDGFEIIAGERRWRAAQLAELREIPVIIRSATDSEVLQLALIENLQRENLNPIEEAAGYLRLGSDFGLTQEIIAVRVGKSRAVVANALRLLRLPLEVQERVRLGVLSVGHAKVILGLQAPQQQLLAARSIEARQLNVRQAEALVERLKGSGTLSARPGPGFEEGVHRDPHVAHLEDRLRERLGTKVSLAYHEGKGSIRIAFFSDDELERLLKIVGADLSDVA